MELSKITKAKLCSSLNIARTTLDAILNGGDTKVSTIEAIANELHVNIGFLFDEELKTDIRQAGRDYVEKGKIEHHGDEYNFPIQGNSESVSETSSNDSDLAKENAELKRKLIAAQERIIELMDKISN